MWRRFILLAREAAELLHVRALVEYCSYEAYADMVVALERAQGISVGHSACHTR